jgi:hypothetical protein
VSPPELRLCRTPSCGCGCPPSCAVSPPELRLRLPPELRCACSGLFIFNPCGVDGADWLVPELRSGWPPRSPKDSNMNNPVQAEGAARGTCHRHPCRYAVIPAAVPPSLPLHRHLCRYAAIPASCVAIPDATPPSLPLRRHLCRYAVIPASCAAIPRLRLRLRRTPELRCGCGCVAPPSCGCVAPPSCAAAASPPALRLRCTPSCGCGCVAPRAALRLLGVIQIQPLRG